MSIREYDKRIRKLEAELKNLKTKPAKARKQKEIDDLVFSQLPF